MARVILPQSHFDAYRSELHTMCAALTAVVNLGVNPQRDQVQQRFRELLRTAHPDTGGTGDHAAKRIADLSEARRILLS